LAFLDDAFVRFVGILNPVLTIIVFGRQEMGDFIDSVWTTAAEGAGREAHRLADFEFVILHKATSVLFRALRSALAVHRRNFNDRLLEMMLLPRITSRCHSLSPYRISEGRTAAVSRPAPRLYWLFLKFNF
jgi:hypothetical protein